MNGSFDLESFEMSTGMHGIGNKMLEALLNADGGGCHGAGIPCEKGHTALFLEYREKKLLTVLGAVTIKRAYYHDKECHTGFCVTYSISIQFVEMIADFTIKPPLDAKRLL